MTYKPDSLSECSKADLPYLEQVFKDTMRKAMEFDTQSQPIPNQEPPMWLLVKEDMLKRNAFGIKKYGTPLQPFNGRDALQDAYEEALDLCVYLRTALYERDKK